MAEDDVIGCFQASVWAKLIAWIQIILNVVLLAFVIWGLVAGLIVEDERLRVKAGALAILGFALVSCLFGACMGIVLLTGLRKGHKGLLTIWIIFAMVQLVWTVVAVIFASVNLGSKVAYLSLNLFLYLFGTRVVYSLF